jgi:2,2-dialkylglycine decarboxylase (pyruvate)
VNDERLVRLIPYAHGFAPITVRRASGSWLEDTAGRRILDFTSGQICSTIGHNHPKIVEAIQRSCETALHLNSWILSEPVLELAKRLTDLAPDPLDRVILLNTGAESNEFALKLARLFTGRFEVAALSRGFHGLVTGVLSVTFQKGPRSGYGPLLPGAFALPAPYAYRCPVRHCDGQCDCTCLEVGMEQLDQQLVGGLAAIIAEPVMSSGGVIVPPDGYLRRLREICDERGALLVLDEAQTGLGRLGDMFGFERDAVVPDLLTLSKTLGGGIPLAATLASAQVVEACTEKGMYHVTSHVSDPLPAEVGIAVLDVIRDEGLVGRARTRGEQLMERLHDLASRYEVIGEVRGRGLLVGLELVEDPESKRPADGLTRAVTVDALERGLSVNVARAGSTANCIRMAPPLTVTEDEIDLGVSILEESLRTVSLALAGRG